MFYTFRRTGTRILKFYISSNYYYFFQFINRIYDATYKTRAHGNWHFVMTYATCSCIELQNNPIYQQLPSYASNIDPWLYTGSNFFIICVTLVLKYYCWRHNWSSLPSNTNQVHWCDVKRKIKIFQNSRKAISKYFDFFFWHHIDIDNLYPCSQIINYNVNNSILVLILRKLQKKNCLYIASGQYYI